MASPGIELSFREKISMYYVFALAGMPILRDVEPQFDPCQQFELLVQPSDTPYCRLQTPQV